MKNFFKSVGKAVLYVLFFLAVQLLTSVLLALTAAFLETILSYSFGVYSTGLTDNLVAAITFVSGLLTLFALWLFFALRRKRLSGETGWHAIPAAQKALLGPLEIGFGMSILASYAISVIPFPESWVSSYAESTALLMRGSPILLFLATVVMAPLVEEVIFRGLVYTRLKQGMRAGIAALLSAVIFGIMHGSLLHMLYTVPMGLVLCLVYEKYRSLWAPVILHVGFNLAGNVIGVYDITDPVVFWFLLGTGAVLVVIGFSSMHWYREDVFR